jgi:hypothetical protein
MKSFESRSHQPQLRGPAFLCGIACLLLCACTDGKGSPIILRDGAGNTLDSSVAGRSGRADAGPVDNDEDQPQPVASLTSDCKRTDSMWPSGFGADEQKLLARINQLRANPASLCPPPPFGAPTALAPLEWDPRLQCSARLRLLVESEPRGPGSGASYSATYGDNPRMQQNQSALHDREKRADVQIDAEIIFTNVGSVEGVIDTLESNSNYAGSFCFVAVGPFLPMMGAARYMNVWVLDFGSGASDSPHSSNTGMSGSGSGNSGSGGR